MHSVNGHVSDDVEPSQLNGSASATKWKILAAAETMLGENWQRSNSSKG